MTLFTFKASGPTIHSKLSFFNGTEFKFLFSIEIIFIRKKMDRLLKLHYVLCYKENLQC